MTSTTSSTSGEPPARCANVYVGLARMSKQEWKPLRHSKWVGGFIHDCPTAHPYACSSRNGMILTHAHVPTAPATIPITTTPTTTASTRTATPRATLSRLPSRSALLPPTPHGRAIPRVPLTRGFADVQNLRAVRVK